MCCKASERVTVVNGKRVPSLVSDALLEREGVADFSTAEGIRSAMCCGLIGAVKAGRMILGLYKASRPAGV